MDIIHQNTKQQHLEQWREDKMSGGSFNYLCYADAEELPLKLADLNDMADSLQRSGAKEAAAETERLIAYVEHSQRQIEARLNRLSGVWKAMEWWTDSDWSEDDFRNAVAVYNAK